MIGWLYRLIVGRFTDCRHEWEIHQTITGKYRVVGGEALIHSLRCKKCGEMKNHRVC
jgi:hypothetical protein